MQDFWLSLVMIFIAELGDKTQLVSLVLATRFNTRVVLTGIFAATLVVHIFSAALGNLVGGLLPESWVLFLSGLAFIAFGFWTLRGDSLDGEAEPHKRLASPFFVVFTVFFLAELGDKTMLGTVTLATTRCFPPGVDRIDTGHGDFRWVGHCGREDHGGSPAGAFGQDRRSHYFLCLRIVGGSDRRCQAKPHGLGAGILGDGNAGLFYVVLSKRLQ